MYFIRLTDADGKKPQVPRPFTQAQKVALNYKLNTG